MLVGEPRNPVEILLIIVLAYERRNSKKPRENSLSPPTIGGIVQRERVCPLSLPGFRPASNIDAYTSWEKLGPVPHVLRGTVRLRVCWR